jgi:hypothetical protein
MQVTYASVACVTKKPARGTCFMVMIHGKEHYPSSSHPSLRSATDEAQTTLSFVHCPVLLRSQPVLLQDVLVGTRLIHVSGCHLVTLATQTSRLMRSLRVVCAKPSRK